MSFSAQKPEEEVLVHLKHNIKTRKSHFLHSKSEVTKRRLEKPSLTLFSESREEGTLGFGYGLFPSPTSSFDLVIAEKKRMQVIAIPASG